MTQGYALFDAFPALESRLSRLVISDLPTPVERLDALERVSGGARLFIKRDDLSAREFGGNKSRKLELILGRLKHQGAPKVLTFGYAGSNHTAATALFANRIGIQCVSMLLPQPNAHIVRRNILIGHRYGAELHHFPSFGRLIVGTLRYWTAKRARRGGLIPIIPPGGSMPLGNCGYVNAAFELRAQVERGEIPEPDRIFVPAGSLGTAAGLIAGLMAAGLKSKVIAVRATERRFANEMTLKIAIHRTTGFLRKQDPSFPRTRPGRDNVEVAHGYFGDGYGMFTKAGVAARRLLQEQAGIPLEGVYSAKAFAAFLDAASDPRAKRETLLFWNTCACGTADEAVAQTDYRDLPKAFHRYFTQEVQPLDAGMYAANGHRNRGALSMYRGGSISGL